MPTNMTNKTQKRKRSEDENEIVKKKVKSKDITEGNKPFPKGTELDVCNSETTETVVLKKKVTKSKQKQKKKEKLQQSTEFDRTVKNESKDGDEKKTEHKTIDEKSCDGKQTNNITENEENSDSRKISKQKKRKKKEKTSDQSLTLDNENAEKEVEGNEPSAKDLAISYLKQWKKQRDQWKFKKVRQYWLVKHMYDSSQVNDKHFKTLLKYLDGMTGKGRQETSTKAQAIIESDSDDVLKIERARKIVQILYTE